MLATPSPTSRCCRPLPARRGRRRRSQPAHAEQRVGRLSTVSKPGRGQRGTRAAFLAAELHPSIMAGLSGPLCSASKSTVGTLQARTCRAGDRRRVGACAQATCSAAHTLCHGCGCLIRPSQLSDPHQHPTSHRRRRAWSPRWRARRRWAAAARRRPPARRRPSLMRRRAPRTATTCWRRTCARTAASRRAPERLRPVQRRLGLTRGRRHRRRAARQPAASGER